MVVESRVPEDLGRVCRESVSPQISFVLLMLDFWSV
jgi:hypothetical protein